MSSSLTSFRFDSASMRDPHPSYARLRAELPVHQTVMPSGLKVWLLTRYHDVRSALADPRLSTDIERARELMQRHTNIGSSGQQMLSKHMLNADPPDHTRLRKLVATAFTTCRVDALKQRSEQLTTSRGHLAFGHGIHYSMGAALAWREGESAFRIPLERFPNIRLAADPHTLRSLIRGLESLPVRLGEPSRAEPGSTDSI